MKMLLRWLALALLAALALQLFFVGRVALLAVLDPASTTFERSELLRLYQAKGERLQWRQHWVPYERISDQLKRAVISSEDDSFSWHEGVDWDAMEKAWLQNAANLTRMAQQDGNGAGRAARPPKIVGGSTITQQLAKNLLLSGERTLLRKGQELVLTFMLEHLLGKRRILELYLNHVEWGEGVFGAEAAAQRYFRKPAAQLNADESARLAVMLPRPRYFEKLPQSTYLAERSAIIAARMWRAELP